LAAAIIIGDGADLVITAGCTGFLRDRDAGLVIKTEQRCHCAHSNRHRLLHCFAAQPKQARSIGNRRCARCGQRRIFAERMARSEIGVAHVRGTGAMRNRRR